MDVVGPLFEGDLRLYGRPLSGYTFA